MTNDFPNDFRCPISLEIMFDPVILSSGHTFDRPSIQRWLDTGHWACPITKLPLSEPPSLIPNHAPPEPNFQLYPRLSPQFTARPGPTNPNLHSHLPIFTV
ncbi:U-box domain-containing protein [Actinidia chinensis var. chinensis]|uniref:U-box domain-containing protein n=1 Tax=Actinidia chinensis var. chinensis TaxID=1590841 RepID=A0A2R6QA08_ACTCC|nr:U-box domain-containing protein [Actinidia chinensis var. chinensis]